MRRKLCLAWTRRRDRIASDRGAVEALVELLSGDGPVAPALRPDVVLVIDDGGLTSRASTPLIGRAEVAAGLTELMTPGTSVSVASVNGAPGFVLVRDKGVVAAGTADVHAGTLSAIWVVSNPEKLRSWNGP